MNELNIKFSEDAVKELTVITAAVEEIISMAIDVFKTGDAKLALKVEPLEETVDYLNELLKDRHIERLKKGGCAVDAGINYLDMLANLERISDHCSNIAVYIIGGQRKQGVIFNRHEYMKEVHEGKADDYKKVLADYMEKYSA